MYSPITNHTSSLSYLYIDVVPGDLEVPRGGVLEVLDGLGEQRLTQRVVDPVTHGEHLDEQSSYKRGDI